MNEKKNESKEEKMKKENNTEVTDFEDLRAKNDNISDDLMKEDKKESEKMTEVSKNSKKDEKGAEETVLDSDKSKEEKADSKKVTDEPGKESDLGTPKDSDKSEKKSETEKDSDESKKESETGKDSDKSEKKSEIEKGSDKSEKESKTEKDSDKSEKKSETEKDSDKSEKKSETEKGLDKGKKESETEKDSDKSEKESETGKDSDKNEKNPKQDTIEDKQESAKEKKEDISSDENKKNALESSKTNKSKKGLWIALASVFGVLLIVYIAGFVYFSSHFYQDVAVNGIKVSGMNKENARQVLDNFYKDYKLTLVLVDGSKEVIDGKDISAAITLKDEFSRCFKEQEAFLWFVKMFEHYDFTIGADSVYDEAALDDIYDSMDILKKNNMESPKDAYVGVVDGKFAIVKEVMGTTIIEEAFRKSVEEGLSTVMAEVNLIDSGCYKLPSVYEDSDELKAELDAKNEYAENDIKLQLDDLTLEPGMELYEDVLEKNGDQYEVSDKKVEKYVEALAKEYDTLDTDRTFTTSWNDRKITTHGETLGYVMNQEQTARALSMALKAKKPATVEAFFDSKGYTLQGENDIGDTYVEVNLSEQHVYAYKNGRKIAEGDCVSGNESAGHGTCIGLYAIQGKQSPAVLRGEKKPVTKTITKKKKGKKVTVEKTTYEYEYESPVTFWMPFNGGIGLHDAAGWRSQYGGSIYYYSGSHGCVNLPYDLASTIYENFEIGDPVIVYFWDNENRK
ncbi:MAG: L,D-transpeptidase family protein [Lachnospiraceae bacterium]|nr:L,D-transpeptidase family protein [Lachnospiraceae bacterium]